MKRREFITLLGGAAARGARATIREAGGRISQEHVGHESDCRDWWLISFAVSAP
jgi:hypothetical protein